MPYRTVSSPKGAGPPVPGAQPAAWGRGGGGLLAGIGKAREARQARQLLQCSVGPWGWPSNLSRQAAGSEWQAGGGLATAEVEAMGSLSLHVPMHTAVLPDRPRPQGPPSCYFFLGKKLNLFSFSFLPTLASGPVREGRGRLCALTRMLWDSLMAVLMLCSHNSISSCRVEMSRSLGVHSPPGTMKGWMCFCDCSLLGEP